MTRLIMIISLVILPLVAVAQITIHPKGKGGGGRTLVPQTPIQMVSGQSFDLVGGGSLFFVAQ